GFACAVPAIMATRSIESRKDRLTTILVIPLVSCSARLPIYTLLIATLFSANERVLGVLSLGGLMMFGLYGLSILFTVGVGYVLKRTVLTSPTPPLVLELPPYRAPELRSVLTRVVDRCWVFIKDAGTVILACSMILWALLYFPSQVPADFELERKQASVAQIASPEARGEAEVQLLDEAEAARVANSIAGQLGHALEPAFAPLGYDWKMVVGILASFAAREVFVSTLGLVYGMGDAADEESLSLRERLRDEVHPDTGKPVYTPLVGLSLMVFFLLALQCMSTLAAVRRETRSWSWTVFAFGYTGALAWIMAFLVYQSGRLWGFA
ncbi:MAG: nucleoside recognition domain-containing protein, partial [Myxococcota bacterium]